jgi:hypothetical protein
MSITITQLYERMSSHIGKETAENLTSYMDNKIKEEVMESTKILATKQDIADLALTTKQDIADLALTTKQDIAETKQLITDLKVEMHGFKSEMKGQLFELLKWISISWATYLGITLTIICLLLKK